ncbi:hypothetical protein C8P64_1972 [Christiangramia gaetbulicola]|uniref:Uncharacterized protein n=1 Tax=Christiangramia gaetbulicola TaxID=703340 RepID=A0A2T6AHZ6_9FLAO|nr:hypothetical protein [Christiangramia gaetbulicola]PTX43444.1 hypothetical protein C8P64_1972 [Christiangramia gaetbulicola]
MKKVLLILIYLVPVLSFSQVKDTVYIRFDQRYDEMEKVDFTELVQAGSPDQKLEKSIDYKVRQMEKDSYGDDKFRFSHFNQSQKAYNHFGGKPPLILQKHKSFLKNRNTLDINFFRTTPYIKIAKTFEEDDSWDEDVLIFIIDIDEIQNDSIILRQVNFNRPVKQ